MATHVVLDQRNISSEDFDGEMVAVNFDSGKYYGLKGCATDIWRMLETPVTTRNIVASLATLYNEKPDDITAAVERFMDQLAAEGVLTETENADPQKVAAPVEPALDGYQPPELEIYSDLQELILLDPVHEIDAEQGWPTRRTAEES